MDDIDLIENLEYSKNLSTEINEKVSIAKVTETRINETSENYRPAAVRGALIYFLLSDLPKIHSFYKFSLDAYLVIMHRAIDSISDDKMFAGSNMCEYGDEEHDEAGLEENAEEKEADEDDEKPEEPQEEEKIEEEP